MVASITLVAAAALWLVLPVDAGLYSKKSPVIQVDSKSYDRLIAKSNYTSIVEFYAPWCGHCKSLQPAYEKAAKSLAGLANVAAVDCDEESNKGFCGSMGVKGFPTLKIVKPGKTPGRPIVEDYQGARTAKAIVEVVKDKTQNLVKRVGDKDLDKWLEASSALPKAILFSEKGRTSHLWKVVAIEFKGSLAVAQIRNTEDGSAELFGISKFPTLILLPAGTDTESETYKGPFDKDSIISFLSEAARPNSEQVLAKAKSKAKQISEAAEQSSLARKKAFESAWISMESSDQPSSATAETTGTTGTAATDSPSPDVDSEEPDAPTERAPSIPILASEDGLREVCLGVKTGTCILVLTPSEPDAQSAAVIDALSEIAQSFRTHHRQIFPFYVVPESNAAAVMLRKSLALGSDTATVAVNARRGWWRRLNAEDYFVQDNPVLTREKVELWIDAIRLGDGIKSKLPTGLVPEVEEEEEDQTESSTPQEPIAEDEEDEPEPSIKHEEL